jgi:hypothetical protein
MVDAHAQAPSPVEPLEAVVDEVQRGQKSIGDLVEAFLEATVVVPSGADPSRSAVQPVLVDVDGVQHVAVFASLPAATQTAKLAPFAVSMRGRDVVRAVQQGAGILVGTVSSGFDLSPALLSEVRQRHNL